MARVLLPFFLFLAAVCLSVGLNILRPQLNTTWGYGFLGFAGVFGLVALSIVIIQWLQRPRIYIYPPTEHDEWVHVAISNRGRRLVGVERAKRARVECTLDGVIHTMRWQAVTLSEPPEFLDLEGGREYRVGVLLQPDADKQLYGMMVKRGRRYLTDASFYILGRYTLENLTMIAPEARTLSFSIRVHHEGGATSPEHFTFTFELRGEGSLPRLLLKKAR